ncbi:AraC family transcriptional regulator [Pseudogulbenkiania sp. MAI-1]|uniref:AraC family transcriptional regulator n=1 Tax=Pseudogulbenkiania sp. MAI-1 TaxID=990370 RepID=UPI00045E6FD3|nr:AraC family transcriptional regulator [Pseudogulbenkiania sp. MAI-1]
MDWDFVRNVTSARLMAELGADHGLPLRTCLDGTEIKEQDLRDPAVLISARQELRLITNLVRHLGHVPALGIEAGKRYHFTAFGALGFAMVSCPNGLSALEVALKYFHLTFAFTRFAVQQVGDQTHVLIDDSTLPEEVRAFVVERDTSALVTVQRDLFPARPALSELYFSFPAPESVGAYEDFYRVRPVFDATSNRAVLNTEALLEPLSQANELALQAAEDQCRSMLDRYQTRIGLSAKVREQLILQGGDIPDMDTVARTMCMTPRTLRRRLLDENTTFLKLRDEVRCALAEELLAERVLSVEQIAERLGYADPTSFINAFKRWNGVTPLSYRKKYKK